MLICGLLDYDDVGIVKSQDLFVNDTEGSALVDSTTLGRLA